MQQKCIHAHAHTLMYIRIHSARLHTPTHPPTPNTHTHKHQHTHSHTRTATHSHAHAHTHTHTCMHAHGDACVHKRKHTCMHARPHSYCTHHVELNGRSVIKASHVMAHIVTPDSHVMAQRAVPKQLPPPRMRCTRQLTHMAHAGPVWPGLGPAGRAAGFPESKTIEKPLVLGAFGLKMLKNHWFLELPC